MAVPATKRGRSASPDEFDDFDTSADDLIRAVDEAETKKARTDPAPGAAADGRALAPDTSPPAPSKPPSTASASETLSAQPGHAFSALGARATPSAQVPLYHGAYAGTDADPLLFERTTMDPAWFKLLEPSMRHASFLKLKQFLDAEKAAGKTIYPPPHLVYNWSRMTPLESVKVVIVGQDPYHQPGQACGLSFSVPRDKVIPPSLQNIYKELKNEFPGFVPPRHGYADALTPAASMGGHARACCCSTRVWYVFAAHTDGQRGRRRLAPQPRVGAVYPRHPVDGAAVGL